MPPSLPSPWAHLSGRPACGIALVGDLGVWRAVREGWCGSLTADVLGEVVRWRRCDPCLTPVGVRVGCLLVRVPVWVRSPWRLPVFGPGVCTPDLTCEGVCGFAEGDRLATALSVNASGCCAAQDVPGILLLAGETRARKGRGDTTSSPTILRRCLLRDSRVRLATRI